jgi:hypothetical protein
MSAIHIHQPAGPMAPPMLTKGMRESLIRGQIAMLRRHEHQLSLLKRSDPRCAHHLRAIARIGDSLAVIDEAP